MVQVDFTPLSEDLSRKMFRLSPLRLFGMFVALGLGLFLMLAFQLTYVFFFLKPEKFEASTWLLLRKERSPRLDCMAKDLVCSQELSGMTFKAVVQKLGSPDSIEYYDFLTKDWLPNPDPKELHEVSYVLQSRYTRLYIWFSPSGVVYKTFIGHIGMP